MEKLVIVDSLVWLVIILAVCAVAFWVNRQFTPAPFATPIGYVIIAVAVVALIYLGAAIIKSFAPPFPGLLIPILALAS